MAREIERLLNDQDDTCEHTMTSLEKKLDAKSDLMMQKLDEILNGSNREERPSPREYSRQATDGDGVHSYAEAKPRTSFDLITLRDPGQPRRGLFG